MGYTTDFEGRIEIVPPLNAEEITFLREFNGTRRMHWKQGPYYIHKVEGEIEDFGQAWDHPDVIDNNREATGQPSLWCQWTPTEDGTAIEWDGSEKFYHSVEWMQYLIDHFIGASPRAKPALQFLGSHVLNGEIEAQGEGRNDRWKLVVKNNVASKIEAPEGDKSYCRPTETAQPISFTDYAAASEQTWHSLDPDNERYKPEPEAT